MDVLSVLIISTGLLAQGENRQGRLQRFGIFQKVIQALGNLLDRVLQQVPSGFVLIKSNERKNPPCRV